ncbi:MAG: right-handed parallel beta-helix repeat-containing protein [Candidatus Hinthialibacter antarcticus]|nr:right-handed parallel beta-helix repeat-containing protein [Candidatus Hinthialibacter antarcticus]
MRTWTRLTILLFLMQFCIVDSFAAKETVFYISPDGDDAASGKNLRSAFATVNRALEEVRSLREDGAERAYTIYLRGGVYEMDEPIVFAPGDSGADNAPLTITSYKNEKPILRGGKAITGWTKQDNGIWTAEIPEVKSGVWSFRELFVNGEKRGRARVPNDGFKIVAGFPDGGREVHYHTDCQRFEYADGDIDPNWTNLQDVEVIVYHFWTDSHLPIQSVDADKRIVTFKHKAGKVFTDDFSSNGARYIVENVFEGLDQPGEWYLNKKTGVLSIIPMPGEDLNKAEVIAPSLPEFIRYEGDPANRRFVENINIENLAFEYTNFELPVGNSNDRQGSSSVPAAITMIGAKNCVIQHCEISKLGTFTVDISTGCTNNKFLSNHIHHIGAGGFRVNGGSYDSSPLMRTGFNTINDNVIEYFGEEYPSAVGVLLMNTQGNRVAHNEIHHGWYTGVSLGWSWGYQPSISRDNVVEFNHIHDIGQGLLSDMGAIYTLGLSPGSVLRNNLIHDVNANHYGGWGIYNDEGSSHLLIENNIVYNTKFAGYNIHFCKEVTVRNNVFALGKLQQLSRSRVEPHQSVFFENNIIYWKEGELLDNKWKDETYDFYFHPKNDSGVREAKSTFTMDWNVFFNPTQPLSDVEFNGMSIDEWRKQGKDQHSVYADPMFVDVDNFDFRLKENSPALDLGFQPIDMSRVGPRSKPGVKDKKR